MGYPDGVTQPAHARAWLLQRERGMHALERIVDDELRQLDDQTALALSEALLDAVPADAASSRIAWSGLVEQQRRFARVRR